MLGKVKDILLLAALHPLLAILGPGYGEATGSPQPGGLPAARHGGKPVPKGNIATPAVAEYGLDSAK